MAFFAKVFSYVVNGLLVESLAKSPAFQKFAVYTNSLYKEGVKNAEPMLREQTQRANDFTKAFRENLSKEMQAVLKESQKKGQVRAPPRQ